jgi:hypothetical protein
MPAVQMFAPGFTLEERIGLVRCFHGKLWPDLTCEVCIKERKPKLKTTKNPKVTKETEEKTDKWHTLWTEEELEIVYGEFSEFSVSPWKKVWRAKEFKELVTEVAERLGRTKKSISFHYYNMFIIDKPEFAGKLLTEFKAKKGIKVEK